MQTVPYIPDNAPFSPEQRAWLNGFLAGLFSSSPGTTVQPATRPVSLRFGVYFASHTGTAERLAKKMAKELKAQGHTAEISSVEKLTLCGSGEAGERTFVGQHLWRRRSTGQCQDLP